MPRFQPSQRAPLSFLKSEDLRALVAWYEKNRRDFPWRRNPDPYWVWIAEVMSQQTQLATLVPYFERFLARFPTIEVLASAPVEEVLAAWAGLGYYSRARNLHKAAGIVAATGFPQTLEGWQALPGIGPYTAAAIASQCFAVAEPVWDGNVLRVCARLQATRNAHAPAFRREAVEALRLRMEGFDPSSLNQAWMELGARLCTPVKPGCPLCPLRKRCQAQQLQRPSDFPAPKPRPTSRPVECRVWVRVDDRPRSQRIWLEPRPKGLWFSGLWDFPSELGGASAPVMPAAKGAAKEPLLTLPRVSHSITCHRISLTPLVYRAAGGASRDARGGWFSIEAVLSEKPPVPLATTARKVLRKLVIAGQGLPLELPRGR